MLPACSLSLPLSLSLSLSLALSSILALLPYVFFLLLTLDLYLTDILLEEHFILRFFLFYFILSLLTLPVTINAAYHSDEVVQNNLYSEDVLVLMFPLRHKIMRPIIMKPSPMNTTHFEWPLSFNSIIHLHRSSSYIVLVETIKQH